MKKEILDSLSQVYAILQKRLPAAVMKNILLTGGTAAAFYGSDRPFSRDIDFMVTEEAVPILEDTLGIHFERRVNKPIFHSLAAEVNVIKGISVDFAIPSIQPEKEGPIFSFTITDEIRRHAKALTAGSFAVKCIPVELLVLIKLLAGRGAALHKYDLFDVSSILESAHDFDMSFFREMIDQFLLPTEKSVPTLLAHLKMAKVERSTSLFSELEKLLKSYE